MCTVPRIGSKRIRSLVARFGTPDKVFGASVRELVEIEGISKQLAQNIKQHKNDSFIENQIQLLQTRNANVVSFWQDEYPPSLKNIPDAPILLYYKGNGLPVGQKSLAIVGTRHPSAYGKLITESFTRDLVRNGFTLVSGLARGVDTIAHQTTVNEGGQTIAVLGSGVDVIYPYENKKLSESICEKGLLVSEFPLGTKPEAMFFPRRNRIIAGLCSATLVIEAGKKSGALITADRAIEQGSDVFAVPGNINSPKSAGCNQLIQQGAKLITNVQDILEEYDSVGAVPVQQQAPPDLSADEKKIFDLLSNEPLHIDRLSEKAGLPTSQVLGVLLSLELRNLAKQIIGKHFIRSF